MVVVFNFDMSSFVFVAWPSCVLFCFSFRPIVHFSCLCDCLPLPGVFHKCPISTASPVYIVCAPCSCCQFLFSFAEPAPVSLCPTIIVFFLAFIPLVFPGLLFSFCNLYFVLLLFPGFLCCNWSLPALCICLFWISVSFLSFV